MKIHNQSIKIMKINSSSTNGFVTIIEMLFDSPVKIILYNYKTNAARQYSTF